MRMVAVKSNIVGMASSNVFRKLLCFFPFCVAPSAAYVRLASQMALRRCQVKPLQHCVLAPATDAHKLVCSTSHLCGRKQWLCAQRLVITALIVAVIVVHQPSDRQTERHANKHERRCRPWLPESIKIAVSRERKLFGRLSTASSPKQLVVAVEVFAGQLIDCAQNHPRS